MQLTFIEKIKSYLGMNKPNSNSIRIETGYGDQFENPNSKIIRKLVEKLSNMDDEHGVFWIADENENLLEINKSGRLLYNLTEYSFEGNCQLNSKEIIIELFILFIDLKFEILRKKLTKIQNK